VGLDGKSPDIISLKQLRQRVQVVFQDPTSSLNPRMKVGEIVSEPIIAPGVAAYLAARQVGTSDPASPIRSSIFGRVSNSKAPGSPMAGRKNRMPSVWSGSWWSRSHSSQDHRNLSFFSVNRCYWALLFGLAPSLFMASMARTLIGLGAVAFLVVRKH
jgi:ABC-type dipeptide/oligopeptide/nickel transport system ATPase subunit